MDDDVEQFVSSVDVEHSTITKYLKTKVRYRFSTVALMTLSYFCVFIFSIGLFPPSSNRGDDIVLFGYSLSESIIYLSSSVWSYIIIGATIISGVFAFALFRYFSNIDCSDSLVVKYRLAQIANEYYSENRDTEKLIKKLRGFEGQLKNESRLFPIPPFRRIYLFKDSHDGLEKYVDILESSNNPDQIIEKSFEEFLIELVKIVETRYDNKLPKIVSSVDSAGTQRSTTYSSILSEVFSDFTFGSRFLTVASVIFASIIGITVFTYVNKDMGMLLTVVLLTGIQIIRGD